MAHVPAWGTYTIFQPASNDGDKILLSFVTLNIRQQLVDVFSTALDVLEHICIVRGQEPADPENAIHFLTNIQNWVKWIYGINFTDLQQSDQVRILIVLHLFHNTVLKHV